jgi:DNA repair protein RadC
VKVEGGDSKSPRGEKMPSKNKFPFRVFEAPEVSSFALGSSHDVYEHFKGYSTADREMFIILFLNSKNKIIDSELHTIGDVDSSAVYPRQVFRSALIRNCASIICVHNHPGGDPEPSICDKDITKALVKGGSLLGVQVLDHIIIAKSGYFSFGDQGLIADYSIAANSY